MTFHHRIFIVFVFGKISKGMLVTLEKAWGNIFNNYIFEMIKMYCRVRYLFDFDLKIHPGQVWPKEHFKIDWPLVHCMTLIKWLCLQHTYHFSSFKLHNWGHATEGVLYYVDIKKGRVLRYDPRNGGSCCYVDVSPPKSHISSSFFLVKTT